MVERGWKKNNKVSKSVFFRFCDTWANLQRPQGEWYWPQGLSRALPEEWGFHALAALPPKRPEILIVTQDKSSIIPHSAMVLLLSVRK